MHSHFIRRLLFVLAAIFSLSTLHPQLLRAQQAPVITMQPMDQYPSAGPAVFFSVVAIGDEPLNYQWRQNGTNLTRCCSGVGGIWGRNTNTLLLDNVQGNDIGSYSVCVSNAYGAVTSAVARLRLAPLAAWGPGWPPIVPTGLSNVVAVAAGKYHSLARTASGQVVGWGYNGYGQTNIPSGLSNVVALAGGAYHSLALTAEGRVVGWGAGGPGISSWPHYGQTTSPSGLSNVVAVAAGDNQSLALTTGGRVIAWGFNGSGETTIPNELSNVVAIAAGDAHSLAVTAEGRVVGWGRNEEGQTNIPSGLSNVIAIAAGMYHSLALTADGRVVGWGHNGFGQTTTPDGLSNVVAIAARAYRSLALTAEGQVVAWGDNRSGESNVPSELSDVVAIAAGSDHTLALVRPPRPILSVSRQGTNLVLNWTSGQPPYQMQQCREFDASNAWTCVGEPLLTNSFLVPLGASNLFLRVRGP